MCRRGVIRVIMTPQLSGDIKASVCGVPTVRLSKSGNFWLVLALFIAEAVGM